RSVSGDGETLWVGAPFADGAVGAVFAFERDAVSGDWLERARLTGPGLEFGDLFGWAVGVSGTHAVAGVAGEDFGAGSAFVYEQNAGSGTWVNAGPLIGSDEGLAAVVGARVVCANGMAVSFPCRNADLLAFLPTSAIGGARGAGVNDLWGWTDPETGMEVAIVGRSDGTSFVDVSDPVHPVFLGNLLTHSEPSSWRDVKVHADHAFIVSEAPEHGMQVFDLTQLRAVVNPPVTFGETAHYAAFSSAHNIVVNEESGFAYVVGANSGGETCGGGLHMVNIQDPVNPLFMGCFADPTTGRAGTGYTHDAQCVIYHGPDVEHRGREICIGSNETAVSIADVTDKSAPVALSTATYPAASYIHQGWLTEDHRYFFQDDELDELRQSFSRTRTYIWDLADLDDPQLLAEYEGTTPSADHNQYVVGSYVFQSNYASGLRILDISDVARPVEVASFDVFPPHDAAGFNGSWSNYPFFESGTVIVSGREAGLFIVEPTGIQVRPPLEPPASFALQAAYPNPFTDRTSITVMLPDEQPLSLVAYDVLGREVARLYEGTLPAGTYVFPFEAADLAGGTYFVRAKGTGKMQTQVVILIR
ncbi:MAG: choice-of-anchor B family protein, partial [Rhodothermales bacterium]